MEFEFVIGAQAGHRVGPDMVGCELQRRVLPGGKGQRFGRLEPDDLDVMRRIDDSGDGSLDDAGRMRNDFVRLWDLDRAALIEYAGAGEHIVAFTRIGDLGFASRLDHAAADDFASAGATTASHATVRDRHVVSAQSIKQIGTGLHLQHAIEWMDNELHGLHWFF